MVFIRTASSRRSQKCKKNWQKSKSIFLTFLGSAVLAGAVALFFNWSRVARVTRFRGYAVSESTETNQISCQILSLDRHHPTEALETMRFGVSNVHGGLLGPEISQVGRRPSWPSGVPGDAASGRVAHSAASSCIGSYIPGVQSQPAIFVTARPPENGA